MVSAAEPALGQFSHNHGQSTCRELGSLPEELAAGGVLRHPVFSAYQERLFKTQR